MKLIAIALVLALAPALDAHARSCGEIKILQTTTKQYGTAGQSVTGIIRHKGKGPIRNVKVCAGEVCEIVRYSMEPGDEAQFFLDADHMMGQGRYQLTTECAAEKSARTNP